MGKISTVCYWIYLITFTISSMLPIGLHLHFLYDDEKNIYSSFVILLYYIPTCLALIAMIDHKQLPTAKWFVRLRYMLAGTMIALNILMIINSIIRLVGFWENIVVTCMLAIVIMYIPISTCFHSNCIEFEFSHLKSTKLSTKHWLVLFGFHTLLAALYATLFLFDERTLEKKELVQNFQFIRFVCQLINILSIPMSYQAVLSWNSDKLRFKGKYPNTSRKWTGLMKRNPDGTWEIDLTPEDHNVFIV
ncbi:hypothetical protein CRE_24622 [Caenorhabditis remanei]|uniref:Uncharacterized protein n=1 Tax=Caenorhabditis remanei TaxID=31234 RepID=E3MVH1_CAERE|nr:hypothetical protein CRE_24622 [Caenorhabditis remanei]